MPTDVIAGSKAKVSMRSGWIALAKLNRCETILLEIMRFLPWEYGRWER